MEIPPSLSEQARQGRVVLLLGAGASLNAVNKKGARAPRGADLAKLLSEKFLGGEFNNADLSNVAEYSVSEHGLLAVQRFIHDIFADFDPTEAHLKLPQFSWGAIATTNYDLLVEKAYQRHSSPLQNPVPFIENGDQVIESLRDPASVMYLKLHGCISRIANEKCPLVLTKDQYITFRSGRERIFDHLHELAFEHTIVFVGHSVQDSDIREVVFELDKSLQARPRFFLVGPNRTNVEKRFWETKKVTVLDGDFSRFLSALDASLGSGARGLRIKGIEQSGVARHFRVSGAVLSKNASEFLLGDALYVKDCTGANHVNPLDFYKGFNGEWGGIEQNLDVPRGFVDDILEDVFLINDLQERKPLEHVVIKGYAGSGKTVALRRIAWQAAKDYDCLCLYLNDGARPNIGAIQEIIELCKERVFLFIDNTPERAHDVKRLLQEVGDSGELLTIVSTARHNEWNLVSAEIQSSVTTAYEVPVLRHDEIEALLKLLEQHKALGRLEEKPPEARLDSFVSLAGRQLLVALHEATLGRPFEEILEHEFRNLVPVEAQRVYLTICILNRLGVPVRAGVIARIHGIRFTDFKERLFKPLEHVVYDRFDERIRDNVYRARHPIIAEIVFERLLRDQTERFQEYFRCLTALNVDYSTDEAAFRQLMRGRTLLDLFSNPDYCNAIFDAAVKMVGEEPHLLQQRALYEMHRPGGNMTAATTYLNRAIERQPYNKSFKHTKSELALKKAENARTSLERDKLLKEAASLALETKDSRSGDTHSHHTLAKVNIRRLEAEIVGGNTDFNTPALQNIIRAVEAVISEGLQAKPGDPYLLNEEAKLARFLKDVPRVVASLEEAVEHNSKLTFLAVELAECYVAAEKFDKARAVFEKAINSNRSDRNLNYRYALFLEKASAPLGDIAYFLKRAFSPGDRNYDAHLRYARILFLNGEYEESRREFQSLRNNRGAPYFFGQRMYEAPGTFNGHVTGVRHSHIFVKESKSQNIIFVPRENVKVESWRRIAEGTKVRFGVGFNFRGPIGFDCEVA